MPLNRKTKVRVGLGIRKIHHNNEEKLFLVSKGNLDPD